MRGRAAKYVSDIVLWTLAAPIAFFLRLGFLDRAAWLDIATILLVATPIRVILLAVSRIERRSWRTATVQDQFALGVVVGIDTVIAFAVGAVAYGINGFPRTAPVIGGVVALFLMGAVRLASRLIWEQSRREAGQEKKVLLVGAGEAGTRMVREMRRHPESGLIPVGYLDDNLDKRRSRLAGAPVLGTTDDLARVARHHQVEEVLITMPSATGEQTRGVVEAARATKLPVRILPGVAQLLTGEFGVARLRSVEVEDLLRREPVPLHVSDVSVYLQGRVVLISGAGGSIGSELVRQVAHFRPGRVVLMGQGENSLHETQQMLAREHPELSHAVVVGNVCERAKVAQVLENFRPEVVFHAAAYKHVPMMENNPDEAILNNIGGTRVMAESCREAGVLRFVNISTDKAVNPVSMLGYTKLLAEEVVREVAGTLHDAGAFVSVRFGNVLGSRGSVIPIFERQIAAGGPVTITDSAMTRFFMTIPEAAQLVVQAGALAENGCVYVLDMGRPVRIEDLAKDLIRLSGRSTERIQIVVTGRRPGEKLHEELFTDDEHPAPTRHAQILSAHASEEPRPGLMADVDGLLAAAQARDWAAIDMRMSALFPTYVSPGPWTTLAREPAAGAGSGSPPLPRHPC